MKLKHRWAFDIHQALALVAVALCAWLFVGAASGCAEGDLLAKGIVVVALESNPTTLDPRLATDASSARIVQLLFNGLLRKDPSGRLVPDLADSWDQKDEVTYVFYLKKGVRFHDGSECDAGDVVSTFRSIMDPSFGSPLRGSFAMVDAVDALDDSTVRFRLKEPFASFLVSLDVGIVPSAMAESRQEDSSAHPIGTGPFRFVSWQRGEAVRLEANPSYFEGRPRLQGLHFKVILDSTVRVLQLRKGTVHLLQNEIEPAMLEDLERRARFRTIKSEGTSYSYLGFNLRDPILKSLEVRKAIAHAIDRQALIDHLLGGLAIPATGVLSPMNWAYEKDVTTYEYDPQKARRLLDEAGYPDPDGEGPAKRFELSYKTSQNDIRRRIGEALQAQLEKVGIGIDMRSYEWATFFSDIRNGNFQLYTLSWVGITDPDIFHYLFHSKSVPPHGANRGCYSNERVDALITAARRTQDPLVRKGLYSAVQKILADELPYVSLWYSMNVVVMDARIRGFQPYPSGDLISLKDVWIEQ